MVESNIKIESIHQEHLFFSPKNILEALGVVKVFGGRGRRKTFLKAMNEWVDNEAQPYPVIQTIEGKGSRKKRVGKGIKKLMFFYLNLSVASSSYFRNGGSNNSTTCLICHLH